MPCRKENYIFLEQSVTVDSTEVDALVSRIGDALQLHNNSSMSRLQGDAGVIASGASAGNAAPTGGPRRKGCCIRFRGRSIRASPYNPPGSGDQEWERFKSKWKREKLHEDDPHQLLQELILSGNLIKEAVRRLQFPPENLDQDTSDPVD